MILFLFLLELLLGPDHDLKTYSRILHFQTTKSHNFSIIRNPYYFFFSFSSVQGPTTQIGPISLGHFEFKIQLHKNPPLLRSYYKNENFFFFESGQFYERPRASLPGTNKAKLASLLHTDHRQQIMTHEDPEVRLAVELALRCRRLPEQFPGAPALVMSRKQAQTGRRLWPHQLLDGSQLAITKQKQQANQHPNARYVSCKTTILRRNIRSVGSFLKVSQLAKIGATTKNLQK